MAIPQKRQRDPGHPPPPPPPSFDVYSGSVITGAKDAASAARKAEVLAAIVDLATYFGFGNVDPILILAQSAFETGHFTSRLIVERNNAFGMRQPTSRQTTSLGPDNGFATYSSLASSVEDYFMRQRNFNVVNTSNVDQYVSATIASGYNTSPSYGATWKAVYRDYGGAGSTIDDGSGDGIYTGNNVGTSSASSPMLLPLLGVAALIAFGTELNKPTPRRRR